MVEKKEKEKEKKQAHADADKDLKDDKGQKEFDWVEYSPEEIEGMITTFANEGHSKSEIGTILRDQYAIPNVKKIVKKSILEILEKHKLSEKIPEDLLNLIKKSVLIEKHLGRNKKDRTAKRGYQLTVSKINRLVKYYNANGKLAKEWKFSPENARLLAK